MDSDPAGIRNLELEVGNSGGAQASERGVARGEAGGRAAAPGSYTASALLRGRCVQRRAENEDEWRKAVAAARSTQHESARTVGTRAGWAAGRLCVGSGRNWR